MPNFACAYLRAWGRRARVHVMATAVFLIYDPSPPSRLPICRRSGGRRGTRAKRGRRGRKKKAIGQFRGERCSAPVSFYGPLKKKRERMNILPVLIDFSSSASFCELLSSTLLRSNHGHSYFYAGSISSGYWKPAQNKCDKLPPPSIIIPALL